MQSLVLVAWCTIALFVGNSVAQDSCATSPFDPSCRDYTPATGLIQNYTTSLCDDMPNMPACYVNQLCTDPAYGLTNDKYCNPFSVYTDICATMRGMTDCSLYGSMCPNTSSVIEECHIPALTLPSYSTVKNLSLTMCQQMRMEACDQCGPTTTICNYFKMYSDLCISMPGMSQCAAWNTMCKSIPHWPLCSNAHSHNPIPVMRMYFHTGIVDYVLFQSWVPNSDVSYAMTWIAVFVFTVLYEVLKLVRTRLEKRWSDSLSVEYETVSGAKVAFLTGEAPFRPKVDFVRATIHTIEVAWGFLVMLVVMTFNVGLCLAVLAGSFIGMLFIGRFVAYVPKASCH